MPVSAQLQRLARKVHRAITPIILVPILLTALTGAVYPMLRSLGFEKSQVKWLMRLHEGDFFVVDLSPIYSVIVGICTILLALTGLAMYVRAARTKPAA